MIGRLFHKKAEESAFLRPGEEFLFDAPEHLALPGGERQARSVSRIRIAAAGMFFLAAFAMIGTRAVTLSIDGGKGGERPRPTTVGEIKMSRADIVDRNGVILASNLPTVDLVADARKVIGPEDAALKLSTAFPDLTYNDVLQKLMSDRPFVFIKRNLTPGQVETALRLGIPGVDFQNGETRVYPQGHTVSHVIGMTDIDGKGTAGMELAYDTLLGKGDAPLVLSIDLRIQHLVREEMLRAIDAYKAKGGVGLVLDIASGEFLAMVSLPDYDPQHPPAGDDPALFNRATKGIYEMGSTFKLFNSAVALDVGTATPNKTYDAAQPIKIASFTIRDFHPLNRRLTVSEILIHSSNIGAALMASEFGTDVQRAYLGKLGLLRTPIIELPEVSQPQAPSPWRPINTMTIAFGHGISVSPLHLANAVPPLVNGGLFRPATLIKRDAERAIPEDAVLSPRTSNIMRQMMRLVVSEGSGKKADVPGYMVGGKTGSAEKIGTNGRYQQNAVITSFIAVFPMSDPRYFVLTLLDEPQGTPETYNFTTAGWNAAPTAGRIVERLAPMMGLRPIYQDPTPEAPARGGVIEAAIQADNTGGPGASR